MPRSATRKAKQAKIVEFKTAPKPAPVRVESSPSIESNCKTQPTSPVLIDPLTDVVSDAKSFIPSKMSYSAFLEQSLMQADTLFAKKFYAEAGALYTSLVRELPPSRAKEKKHCEARQKECDDYVEGLTVIQAQLQAAVTPADQKANNDATAEIIAILQTAASNSDPVNILRQCASKFFATGIKNLREPATAEKAFNAALKLLQEIPAEKLTSKDKARIGNCEAQIEQLELAARLKAFISDPLLTVSAIIDSKQETAVDIKSILAAANKFYELCDLPSALAKYQVALDKLAAKQELKWIAPEEQADKDFCINRINECERLIEVRKGDAKMIASLQTVFTPGSTVAAKLSADEKIRNIAKFKMQEGEDAFINEKNYSKAIKDYSDALEYFSKIIIRSTSDGADICRCSVQRKDCAWRQRKNDELQAGLVVTQYGFFINGERPEIIMGSPKPPDIKLDIQTQKIIDELITGHGLMDYLSTLRNRSLP